MTSSDIPYKHSSTTIQVLLLDPVAPPAGTIPLILQKSEVDELHCDNSKLIENTLWKPNYDLKKGLTDLMKKHPVIGDVRGIGLLIGVEMVADRDTKEKFSKDVDVAGRINKEFRKNGLILQSDGNVITVGPPLCVTQSDCDEIIDGIDASLEAIEQQLGVK